MGEHWRHDHGPQHVRPDSWGMAGDRGAAGGARTRRTTTQCSCLPTTHVNRSRWRVAPRFTSSPTGSSRRSRRPRTPRRTGIWLAGGASVVNQYLAAGLVDEIDISIAPVISARRAAVRGGPARHGQAQAGQGRRRAWRHAHQVRGRLTRSAHRRDRSYPPPVTPETPTRTEVPRCFRAAAFPITATPDHHRIAIVGAGFAGLGTAIQAQAGRRSRTSSCSSAPSDVGGTWRDNTYPGCRVRHALAPVLVLVRAEPRLDADRTRRSPRSGSTCERVARRARHRPAHPLRPRGRRARAGTRSGQLWRIETERGRAHRRDPGRRHRAPLSEPEAAGDRRASRRFAGHDVPLRAVGPRALARRQARRGDRHRRLRRSSSCPQIQPEVGEAARLPAHAAVDRAAPRPRRSSRARAAAVPLLPAGAAAACAAASTGARELFVLGARMHPRAGCAGSSALARKHLRAQVPDPELRAKLTPRYRIGCKRMLISNDYYPALQQPNVEVVDRLDRARSRPHGIVTADGVEREVDTIIFGTGFHVTDMPRRRVGARARRAHAGRASGRAAPQAYLGTTVAGFPNLFLLVGPEHRPRPQLDRVHDRVPARTT